MKKVYREDINEELQHLYTDNKFDIKIHRNEVMSILNNRDFLYMNQFIVNENNSVAKTTNLILDSFSREFKLKNINNILMHFHISKKINISTILDESFYTYKERIRYKANIYLGVSYDESLPKNYVKATVLI
ncbi:MAG: hypothetical protein U9N59_00115 [Campylobacterota bacterium]|nr:hypothetical protein [Campylobacterota bacterium]